jgi:hypothetical protein
VEWLKAKPLSSSPSTTKKRKKVRKRKERNIDLIGVASRMVVSRGWEKWG